MKRFAYALVCLASISISAQARTIHESNVDGWIVGAYSNDRTGQFSHCATSVNYKSGVTLFFFLTKEYAWTMGLSNSRWRLTPGSRFNIVYYIDSGQRTVTGASVTSAQLVVVPLADSKALFEDFRRGHKLTVEAANETIAFKLTNSATALAATMQCTQSHVAGRQPDNPFTYRQPPAQGTPSHSPAIGGNEAYRTEAAILIANTIAPVGLPGFRVLPRTEISSQDQRFDGVWVADGGLMGAVNIVAPQAGSKVDDVSAVLLAFDAQACKGAFTSGRYPTQDGIGIGRLMTACTEPTGSTEVQYTIAPRPSGGFYVLGVAGPGQNSPSILDAGKRIHEAASRGFAVR